MKYRGTAWTTKRSGPEQLAIVVGSLGHASETFIEAHILDLAQGRGVVLCTGGVSSTGGSGVIRLPPLRRAGLVWPARKLLGALELMRTGVRMPFDWRQETAAERVLREAGVTKVLAEYGPIGCSVARACALVGAELFVHFHGADASMLLRNRIWRRKYRRLARGAAGFIAPSSYLAERLAAVGIPRDLLHVVPCGVDPEEFPFTEPPADGQRVLAVGRLVEKKAPHLLIAAFAIAGVSHPGATLEIIGDGPLLRRCCEEVRAHGLTGRVVLHGARPHAFVKERMRGAAVFAQHSVTALDGDTEGLGVAILEAMMSGLPVVSTRHNGIPETVIDGETGILVDERNVIGMACGLTDLLAAPERARRMGEAGRSRALAHFTRAASTMRLRQVMDLTSGGLEAGPESCPKNASTSVQEPARAG